MSREATRALNSGVSGGGAEVFTNAVSTEHCAKLLTYTELMESDDVNICSNTSPAEKLARPKAPNGEDPPFTPATDEDILTWNPNALMVSEKESNDPA